MKMGKDFRFSTVKQLKIKIQKIMRKSKQRNRERLHPTPILISLFLIIIFCSQISATSNGLKIINVADSQYQKIFLMQQRETSLFLILSCKQKNMLSILISTQLNYQEAPRFNIYGNHQDVPKMADYTGTTFDQCQVSIHLNTSSLIEIWRRGNVNILLAIDQVKFQQLHHQFSLRDQSQKWGLGQRFQKHFHLKDGRWTIYNRDKPWRIDMGKMGSSDQTYGHHPVYLARQKATRLYHLVYFRNTYGMMIDSLQNSEQLIFNSVGGNIHLVIICGGKDPEQVIEQYHMYIGASHIPPFWSLGYHQSRWGYHNLGYIEQVVVQFNKNRLPLDCVWADLDYMKDKQIFTIDEVKFPPKDLNNMLEEYELHFVPLLDVAIATSDKQAVKLGKELDIFLKINESKKSYYTGQVWPGRVYYIDYLHPNSSLYWCTQLQRLNKKINFSGIWLDMNEPTNFKGGQDTKQTLRIQHVESINSMTIDADIKHYSGSSKQLFHREVHSYYGHLSVVPTFEFLKKDGRPFIISRSTSVGSGMFAGHWTGDNVANWEFLRLSISGNFLFQIFGIQMVGADICGFYQDTTQQLCSRWMQLGSFYPFARNHNHQAAISQQPYEFGQMLLQTSKLSLMTRYSLLKQLYTFMVAKKGKGSFFRPLSFEFYDDENVYDEEIIETQFLMGRCLMVAPIVYENDQDRYVYFPGEGEEWYKFSIDIRYGMIIERQIQYFMSSAAEVIENILPSPPLTFLRGGHMLFLNRPTYRTHKLSNQFNIFAALYNNQTEGDILGIKDYEKERELQKCIEQGCSYRVIIRKFDDYFHLEWQFNGDEQIIGEIVINNILLVSGSSKWKHNQKIVLNSTNGAMGFISKGISI